MHSVRHLARFGSRRLHHLRCVRTQQLEVCRAAFSSAPSSNPEPDWVKESIQKLLEHHHASSTATGEERDGPGDLDKSLHALQVSTLLLGYGSSC